METEQGARPPVQSRDTGAAKEPQTPSAPRVGENNVGVGGNPELSFAPRVVAHPAAYDFNRYLPGLRGKRVGLVVNQTSTVSDRHLVDALLDQEINVKIIFAPEHGFRGEADAGATISNGTDVATGLPIKSLYGKNKKPSAADLAGVDVIVFDVQDVGARFYTYISTLLYVMESAARYGKEVLVLDRPNPNGKLIDGPVLKSAFTSFVGVAPIPVAHGLTVGEFARMANGEDWLADGLKTELTVIPMLGYAHDQVYELPTPPSPNLPNQRSIYLYPHLCFFEGTALSVGRGTMKQFQLYGHPSLSYGNIRFTPTPGPGSSSPKLEGQLCRGEDLTQLSIGQLQNLTQLNLEYLTNAHRDLTDQGITFFTRPDFFDLLAGTDELRKAISAGATPAQIRATWADDLADYRSDRQRYLLYP
ncbi:exo-beta-N-acetylmuramidase NamZ family protein [Neolewinella antarctica]|uniref:Uncharacterized protein YbbC (DUF1343 family) n=1 Tax=Neolewinella antarctica TaxID=442734 RepID=A0ABX0XDQ8_9BACT|nr:DUF1343 domain-containing protein [Neolewinella antarctica]NJC26943.1 uncharacterized protein YbbC (DUF1343 family) [Neolewinella antarctica]